MRQVTREELLVRIEAGDTGFLNWMKSAERRNQFLTPRRDSAGTRFLAGFWRRVAALNPGLAMLLNFGCGIGAHADALLRSDLDRIRYVGMDMDPECVKICRQRFASLNAFQFHNADFVNPPKIMRDFTYIAVTQIFSGLVSYQHLLSYLWNHCELGLVVLFEEPLVRRTTDHLRLDPLKPKLHTVYSLSRFESFCDKLSEHCEFWTVYSDNSQTKEHVALLKKVEDTPSMEGLHHFAENGSTFPFAEEGLL